MPRIQPNSMSELYQKVELSSAINREGRDCAVRAVAILCGVDYKIVRDEMERIGRKKGHGTRMWITHTALNHFGFATVRVPHLEFIQKYPGYKPHWKGITTHHPTRFSKVWKDGHNYLFVTSRHVAAVIDGRTHDWSDNRALRVLSVYRIVKTEVTK